ncbi:MAG TPA: asparagine synthase (glutamine-hydrolyzing), partial [Pirellulales bacterium]|nr:asparagine synthase (glutamine-hydrolyzing) [Pirellulales bacterium]
QPAVALAHRRLSIIDVAAGHQPMSNEDGSIWLVFNGEIYNFQDLRRRLEGAGHQFRTRSDSEVLVHLYEDEGVDFLQHLNGMFALAIWDEPRARLLLARDRLGEKPLVYRHEPGRLLFASELKSLLAVPGLPRRVNPQALDEYLTYQYVPHPHSMLEGFAKLPPAHYALLEEGQLSIRRYWSPDFRRQVDRPLSENIAELRALLTDAVRLRIQSDVPWGAFLSGGVDSSLIVGLMQQLAAAPVKTFSIGFAEPEYDESAYARQVAQRLGTEHYELRVGAEQLAILPKLVWQLDEPLADSSAVATFLVARLARERVTVALTGDGGDELFAGYTRYRASRLAGWLDGLPRGVRRLAGAPLWRHLERNRPQRSLLRRGVRFGQALALSPQRRHVEWVAIFGESRRAALYSDEFLATLPGCDPAAFYEAAFARSAGRDATTRCTLADLETYLPCDLLAKVDLTSMANSLECRQPFLDHRIVELAAAMPLAHKLGWASGKRILRRAFADLMPAERPKRGFAVPLDHWFRGPLKSVLREVLLDPAALARGYFRSAAVERLIAQHESGAFDHSSRLWALLVLEWWHREWIDGRTAG